VSSDYLPYQFWDSLQGLSSYVRGMLAGQALLAAVHHIELFEQPACCIRCKQRWWWIATDSSLWARAIASCWFTSEVVLGDQINSAPDNVNEPALRKQQTLLLCLAGQAAAIGSPPPPLGRLHTQNRHKHQFER
jgi:hypothetical protein